MKQRRIITPGRIGLRKFEAAHRKLQALGGELSVPPYTEFKLYNHPPRIERITTIGDVAVNEMCQVSTGELIATKDGALLDLLDAKNVLTSITAAVLEARPNR